MASYVDSTGVANLTADIKALADETYLNGVSYDSVNKKLTKTVGSTTNDIVTLTTIKTDLGLSDISFELVRSI